MAGRVINIIPRTSFSFNTPASVQSTQALGPRSIATPDWVSGTLLVRVHSASIPVSTTTVVISARNVSVTPDDPNVLFLDSGSPLVASITLPTNPTPVGNTAGSLRTAALAAPIGSMLAIYLTMTQGSTAGITAFEISVDLVGRDQLVSPEEPAQKSGNGYLQRPNATLLVWPLGASHEQR